MDRGVCGASRIVPHDATTRTPSQATEAYNGRMTGQWCAKLPPSRFLSLFAEKKPLMINVGKAKQQQADGLKEHWDSIGSRLDQEKLPEAFSIDFIDKSDILGAFRSALMETIDAKLKGESVDFDTFMNQYLQWKEIEFVKGIGFKLPFDLLPGRTDNPLGTLFFGTGGFSVNSFGPNWKDNQSLKINITQPLMEWENKRLYFEIGGGYKFNGKLDGGITGKFEKEFR